MSNTKFTPGPWEWANRSEVSDIKSNNSTIPFAIHKVIGRSAVMPIADICNFPPASDKQVEIMEANAKLIAAAPELLETLTEVWNYISSSEVEGKESIALYNKVEAAIKKATE